jgi:hypothetical protein
MVPLDVAPKPLRDFIPDKKVDAKRKTALVQRLP